MYNCKDERLFHLPCCWIRWIGTPFFAAVVAPPRLIEWRPKCVGSSPASLRADLTSSRVRVYEIGLAEFCSDLRPLELCSARRIGRGESEPILARSRYLLNKVTGQLPSTEAAIITVWPCPIWSVFERRMVNLAALSPTNSMSCPSNWMTSENRRNPQNEIIIITATRSRSRPQLGAAKSWKILSIISGVMGVLTLVRAGNSLAATLKNPRR